MNLFFLKPEIIFHRSTIGILLALMIAGCQQTPQLSVDEDRKKVKEILKNIDDFQSDMDTKMSVYSDEVVHMAQGSRAITSKAELRKVLEKEAGYGTTKMTHELVTIHSYPDMVLTRGRVTGTWDPADSRPIIPFETNNIITFRRMEDGTLKIWQVIFNRVNLENYSN